MLIISEIYEKQKNHIHFYCRHKFSVWAWNMWNPFDAVAIIFFVIGLTFRFRENTMDIGRVIYCVDSIYWYLRILNILGVNKYLGKNFFLLCYKS